MNKDKPKGKLIPIGGAEAKGPEMNAKDTGISFFKNGILEEVLKQIKCEDSHIGLITTASNHPVEIAETYVKAFNKLGCRKIEVMHLDKRNVDSAANLKLLDQFHGVFMSGGDQMRLQEKIGDSQFLKKMRQRYIESNFVIAGTSAGAMIMSELMISSGQNSESLVKGIENLEKGFNLLKGVIIDPHFMIRGRFARLTEALLKHEDMIALGICEDTAVVISEGNELDTIGSGTVLVLEGSNIKSTNFKTAREKEPIYVEGLGTQILARGAKYLLKERKFIAG